MTQPEILIAEPEGFSPRALSMLEAHASVVVETVPPGELGVHLQRFDAVWVRLAHRVSASDVVDNRRCRVIACPATGLDHIDVEACSRAGIRIVALKGEVEFLKNVRATAEHTLALALAVLRKLPAAVRSVQQGNWDRNPFKGNELHGKTAALIGVGRLGALVAGYLNAFGMRVVGYDVRDDFPTGVERRPSLVAAVGDADLVSLHVAYDRSTHGLFGASAFAAMKPGAFLINTSRGGVVDEAAMLAALSSGRLAGAGLDVLTGEPGVDATHPLVAYARAHDNVVITPHVGGNTFESFEKTEVFIAGKLLEALRA